MPTLTEHAFQKLITSGSFAPVYYLYGDDDFRKDEAAAQALEAAVGGELREFNLEVRRGGEVDAETLESVLGTPPLMAARRAVAVRDIGALKKDARRALDRYLEHPAPDTLLLLIAVAGDKPDRGLSGSAVSVEFPVLKGDRLPKWVVHRASALGATITPGAVALLQEAAGTELTALASELDKLASYVRGTVVGPTSGAPAALAIDEDAVAAVVGVRRGETMGDLLDRVGERDVSGALALVGHVMAQPKTTAVGLVMALSVQTLALGWGAAQRRAGTPTGRLASGFFTLLKETRANPMRPWGEAIDSWIRVVDRWNEDAVERALDALLAADAGLKDTRVSSDEQVIRSLVLAMCGPGEQGTGPAQGRVLAAGRVNRGVAA